MKLEQIDTSTTAGKARVMHLAAEGRKVATRFSHNGASWSVVEPDDQPLWNWGNNDYAIIAEPVGPDEVWITVVGGKYVKDVFPTWEEAASDLSNGAEVIRYVRGTSD